MPALASTGPATPATHPADARPALGTTYGGGDPALLEAILPLVDVIELSPDTLAVRGPDGARLPAGAVAELRDIAADATVVVHGVGLSIGTATGMSETYLHLLDSLLDQVEVGWHSEHLGYTTVDGRFLGTMLTLPRTDEALDLVCSRVEAIHDRYRLPFLLENVVHLLPDPAASYTEAEFLNQIAARTGCGLLVDAYNLRCDAHNYGLDLATFVTEVDGRAIGEVHVAGGVTRGPLMLDVHSRLVAPATLAVADDVLDHASRRPVLMYELMREAVPVLGIEAICTELEALRRWVDER